jgi:hypothetical protein
MIWRSQFKELRTEKLWNPMDIFRNAALLLSVDMSNNELEASKFTSQSESIQPQHVSPPPPMPLQENSVQAIIIPRK